MYYINILFIFFIAFNGANSLADSFESSEMRGTRSRSYRDWVYNPFYKSYHCARVTKDGNLIKWIKEDKCTDYFYDYKFDPFIHTHRCAKFTPDGGLIRWAKDEYCD